MTGFAVCVLGLLVGVEPVGGAPGLWQVETERLRASVERLASEEFGGRGSREDRGQTAAYLASRFRAEGLSPLFEGKEGAAGVPRAEETIRDYLQNVPGPAKAGDERPLAERPALGWNVGGLIPGGDPAVADELVIVSAHFDHLGRRGGELYPGADDNASGVAMCLELARVWGRSKVRPRRSIAVVGFDLEERMLWGSTWFAGHPPRPLSQVKLFITADMIGRALGDLPLKDIFMLGAEHGKGLAEVVAGVPRDEGLKVSRLGVDFIGTRSDYGPFRDAEVPFLFFSSGEHPDYHSPRDTADRIDFEKVTQVTRLVGEVAWTVANAETTPEWQGRGEPEVVEVETLVHVCDQLIARDEVERKAGRGGFTALQRLLVTNTRNQARAIVGRGRLDADERGWLMRSAQLLLATVL
jgi:hypothetical protein